MTETSPTETKKFNYSAAIIPREGYITNSKQGNVSESVKTEDVSQDKDSMANRMNDLFREKVGEPHPFDYTLIDSVIQKVGYANAVVDKYTDNIVGKGIFFSSEDEDLVQFFNDYVKKSKLKLAIRPAVKEAIAKGVGYIETGDISKDLDKQVTKFVCSNNMFIKKDKIGNIVQYTQYLGDSKSQVSDKDIIPLTPNQMVHFTINKIGTSAYGNGILYSALSAFDNFALTQKASHTLVERKANSPLHVKIGNEEKEDYPSQTDITAFAQQLVWLRNNQEFVTGPNVELKVIDFGNLGDKFEAMFDNDYKLLSYSLQVPEIFMGADRGYSGSSEIQESSFERNCQAKQEEIIVELKSKIFDVLASLINKPDVEYEVKFDTQTDSQKAKQIAQYQQLLATMGTSPGMKKELERKIADMLGIDYEVVEEENEAEEEKQKQNMKDEFKMQQKPGFPVKQNTQTNIQEVANFKIRENYFKDENINESVDNDNVKVSEWVHTDITKYKEQIVKSIISDKFDRLLANNEEELQQGYLTQEEIEKVKEILGSAVIQNKTIGDIKRDIILKLNLKDLTEKVKLPAERRINTIVKTEMTRMLNKGIYEATNQYTLLYLWDATIDERTCPVCAQLSNKIFESDTLTQDMVPPIHVNCRCSLLPYSIEFNNENVGVKSIIEQMQKGEISPQEAEIELSKHNKVGLEKVQKFISKILELNKKDGHTN